MTTFVILPNTNNPYGGGADHIIHRADCRDTQCVKALRYDRPFIIDAETVEEADQKFRADRYSDFEPESQQMFSGELKPCCRKVPVAA